MTAKTVPPLSSIDRMLDEVDGSYRAVEKLRVRLKRLKAGCDDHDDLLGDLHVQLIILLAKVETASTALDQYQESLAEND